MDWTETLDSRGLRLFREAQATLRYIERLRKISNVLLFILEVLVILIAYLLVLGLSSGGGAFAKSLMELLVLLLIAAPFGLGLCLIYAICERKENTMLDNSKEYEKITEYIKYALSYGDQRNKKQIKKVALPLALVESVVLILASIGF